MSAGPDSQPTAPFERERDDTSALLEPSEVAPPAWDQPGRTLLPRGSQDSRPIARPHDIRPTIVLDQRSSYASAAEHSTMLGAVYALGAVSIFGLGILVGSML